MEGRKKSRGWALWMQKLKVVVFFNEKANKSEMLDSFRTERRTKAKGLISKS